MKSTGQDWQRTSKCGEHRYIYLVGKLMEKDHFDDLGIDGWIISKYILKQQGWMA
jgi:hypothetical protein